MGYLIGLFLILGLVFYSFNPFGFGGNILGNLTSYIGGGFNSLQSKIYDTIFPKSEKETLLDKLDSNYGFLSRFFGETAPQILKSKNISDNEKKALEQAIVKFNESQKSLQNIQKLQKDDKGIVKSIVDKIFNKDDADTSQEQSEPTSIPPQCQLVCGQ